MVISEYHDVQIKKEPLDDIDKKTEETSENLDFPIALYLENGTQIIKDSNSEPVCSQCEKVFPNYASYRSMINHYKEEHPTLLKKAKNVSDNFPDTNKIAQPLKTVKKRRPSARF